MEVFGTDNSFDDELVFDAADELHRLFKFPNAPEMGLENDLLVWAGDNNGGGTEVEGLA